MFCNWVNALYSYLRMSLQQNLSPLAKGGTVPVVIADLIRELRCNRAESQDANRKIYSLLSSSWYMLHFVSCKVGAPNREKHGGKEFSRCATKNIEKRDSMAVIK